jgi:hypothetical protein
MRALTLTVSALILAGCAVGRTASYSETSIAMPGATSSGGAVALAVQDRRSYVLSGNKPERFVGLMRGGFGNPFDVNTATGGPVATDVRDTISRSLTSQGYKVSVVALDPKESADAVQAKLRAAGARRSALLTLTEWKSDSYWNIGIIYDATLTISDEKGKSLAINTVKGEDNLGYVGLNPEPTITAGFAKKLELLFADPRVAAALK